MNKLAVVVDTNIFINGLFFSEKHKDCVKILDYIDSGKIIPLFSQDTIGELMYLMKNFAKHNLEYHSERLMYLHGITDVIYYGFSINTENVDCPDVDDINDKMFLKIAYKQNVDYIITNDKKSGLFNMWDKVKVVTAEGFLNIYSTDNKEIAIE
ncbi:putative toxin-antitoxin system toxin component, PIN family [Clostridium novyi]